MAVALVACGSPNAKIIDGDPLGQNVPDRTLPELSEADKIHKLIDVVRSSNAHFVLGDKDQTGGQAASELDRRLPRMSVTTARQFVERLTSLRDPKQPEPQVRLADGTLVPAKDWYLARLQDIEGGPRLTQREIQAEANGDAPKPPSVGILDALTIIERSQLKFVAPARRTPSGERKGKQKDYPAQEFADMLRKKWDFLGADIRDLEHFITEIAASSFSTMEPYQVVLADGNTQDVEPWLRTQLEARRKALARARTP